MQPLEQEVNRIRNELANLGCELMFGKTCAELVQEIFEDMANYEEYSLNN